MGANSLTTESALMLRIYPQRNCLDRETALRMRKTLRADLTLERLLNELSKIAFGCELLDFRLDVNISHHVDLREMPGARPSGSSHCAARARDSLPVRR
jgi:hypothetical protein